MKLLAILKDSLREAIDVRVFYLLVAASCGLILMFASLTFTPRPAHEFLSAVQAPFSLALLERRPATDGMEPLAMGRMFFDLRGVEPVDGAPDRPQSPLRFTVLAQYSDPAEAARVKEFPGPTEELLRQRFGRFGSVRALEVTGVRMVAHDTSEQAPALAARQVYFEVATRPNRVTLRVWPHDSSLLFGVLPLGGLWQFLAMAAGGHGTEKEVPGLGLQVYFLEEMLVNGFGSWGAVLVSVLVAAFFIPSMLQKGALDLLLVKPLQRWRLLLYKYLGGLAFIALNTTIAVVGVWLVLALRTGIWCHGLLLLIPVLTFCFAILYAVSTLVSVLTHSPIVSILITCLVWVLFWGVGRAHQYFHDPQGNGRPVAVSSMTEEVLAQGVDGLHFILPRTQDLGKLTSDLLAADLLPELQADDRSRAPSTLHWGESLTVSCVFIAVMLGLACLRFCTKDY